MLPVPVTPPADAERPDTEVSPKPKRRRYTAQYKLAVLEQADACRDPGEIGRLLRREGLYSSHLSSWRRQREHGALAGLAPRKRGPAAKQRDERDERIAQLERELAKVRARAELAEALVEVQKKVSVLLGVELPKGEGRS